MSEIVLYAWKVVNALAFCAMFSGAAAFGVAFVCRQMKWAPINITVNVERKSSDKDDEQ